MCIDHPVVFLNKSLSYYRNTEDDSASTLYYEPDDFMIFLKTLIETKGLVNNFDRGYFARYCNRFVLLTYIKNYRHYSSAEDREVVTLARKVVTGWYKILLNLLKWIPYKKTYGFFKLFRRK